MPEDTTFRAEWSRPREHRGELWVMFLWLASACMVAGFVLLGHLGPGKGNLLVNSDSAATYLIVTCAAVVGVSVATLISVLAHMCAIDTDEGTSKPSVRVPLAIFAIGALVSAVEVLRFMLGIWFAGPKAVNLDAVTMLFNIASSSGLGSCIWIIMSGGGLPTGAGAFVGTILGVMWFGLVALVTGAFM